MLTSAAFLGLLLTTASVTFAQTAVKETTTTTTTSTGTVSELGGETLLIRPEDSAEPLRYSHGKTTTYVDEEGRPVSIRTVKSGLPVTVYYVKDGDRMVATKVIVRKEGSTAVTAVGTISDFGPEMLVIRSGTSAEPIRYSYTKTTAYIDEAGRPVSVETVKSGLPVTVYYTKLGDRMVVSKVVVRKPVADAAPLIEEKKTTTTVTEKK
jgi:endonuclease YncB( thermonuclease family)